ncbi:hypothetical protein PAHAL_7G228800 [Panicum hallii]|nr:hypothetical protein PAHAL_7G228800 [Panicum hallii]PAN39221.1 hypothetical protein PAHAL_7G228800 [Panicum hallii]
MGHRCFLPLNEQPTNRPFLAQQIRSSSRAPRARTDWPSQEPKYCGGLLDGPLQATTGPLTPPRASAPAPSIAPIARKYPPSTVASGSEARKAPERSNTAGGVCLLPMATSTVAGAALLCPSPRFPAALSRRGSPSAVAGRTRRRRRGAAGVVRACFNPLGDERILREAIKEPVAFMGGVFAGLLRLDLNEDPLKEWMTRTVEASGIAEENSSEESSEADQNDAPQQIEIE